VNLLLNSLGLSCGATNKCGRRGLSLVSFWHYLMLLDPCHARWTSLGRHTWAAREDFSTHDNDHVGPLPAATRPHGHGLSIRLTFLTRVRDQIIYSLV
jgi:hypothetical protein